MRIDVQFTSRCADVDVVRAVVLAPASKLNRSAFGGEERRSAHNADVHPGVGICSHADRVRPGGAAVAAGHAMFRRHRCRATSPTVAREGSSRRTRPFARRTVVSDTNVVLRLRAAWTWSVRFVAYWTM